MKPFRTILVTAVLACLLCGVSIAPAQDDPLAWAGADTEFAVSINMRQLADSTLMQKALVAVGTEKSTAMLQVFKNLTDIDLMKDIDRAYAWGRVKDDNSVVFVLRGRFNPEKVVTLLKAGPQYAQGSHNGITIHEWFDNNEKRMKHGAFADSGTAVVANQKETLLAVLDAKGKNTGFLSTEKARLLPAGHKDTTAWMLLIRPDRTFPDGDFKDTLQASSATVTLSLREAKMAMRLSVNTESAAAADQWQKMLQGGLALLQLQKENAEARELANAAKTSIEPGASRVSLDFEIAEDKVIELIRQKQGQ